ncbi:MAG: DUF4837 family protein [Flavobacteriales bacterium]|nr:MAG: DUF4837 family protein [Flavobacteriales bacterium]CAI8396837.1 MAG: Uncharacterised protein [Flavobacteriales bacterium]|tara:strand:- start:1516 stop:2493 length:978 start_codon:yes stop_codon:yes gene_type:complete
MIIKDSFIALLICILFTSCQSNGSKAYVPESNGNINSLTIVMGKNAWGGNLGKSIKASLMEPYEGLPFDEPKYDLYHLEPSLFSGFARSGRNILVFNRDTTDQGFRLIRNLWARPQITAIITGEDQDVMNFYFEENKSLLMRSISENERLEKIRRMSKSLNSDSQLIDRYGINLTFPDAYETVKDTTNFVWIEKQVVKGHLNIIAYTLPYEIDLKKIEERIPKIRDSIGELYIPGRVPGSYMITERAYLPYYYKTKVNNLDAILTKGTWEVQNDFMAGPYVNYIIKDTINKRNIVLEGFSFAPSESKRDYMFELNTIITTMRLVN